MSTKFDVVIIGGGPGGYVAAIRAAQLGASRVALVEKRRLGGTCLNRGCIPTKAMVHDAELYQRVTSQIFCVDTDGSFRVNFSRMMQRKRRVVDTLVQGVEHLMQSHGVDVFSGEGKIIRPGAVRVYSDSEEQTLETRAIVIATGSVPAQVPIPGTDLPGVLTSDELLELEELPRSMVVIGGSVVGVEFASIFAALGVQVTILGRRTFLRDAEQRLAKRFRSLLSRKGVSITIGLDFKGITRTDSGMLRVAYERRGKPGFAEAEIVLLATGRWPYTEGVGLEDVGIEKEGRAIRVNEYLETNIPGIYAIGDCIGGYMLAHVASYEAEVAIDNIMGRKRAVDYRVVPNCIFTMPEIAGVGLTEAQAKEAGLAFKVTRFPFSVNGRAVAMGETEGQVRILCEQTSDGKGGRVLGVHIMGPHACELIAEAALAMRLGATAEDIAQTIHAHPTVSEALMEAAMAQLEGAIHYELK
ncbi:MAG: dihydrolipoyl dehydrogenase [Anaerolineae bacterium]|nr:dihydrolipoyl dehydrogenase [Anaerolineae bacterium]